MSVNCTTFFCGARPGDLAGSHDGLLVALSILIAAVGSYTALDLAGRVRVSERGTRHFWLWLSATAMGGGIWSMHFVAMLAFQLETPIGYDTLLTLASLITAIIVSAAGLDIASRVKRPSLFSMLPAGIYLGVGVAVMHHTGMAAMNMKAALSYEPWLFSLSVVVAVVAGTVALWLAFTLDRRRQKIIAAAVMAVAIAGMHYTGMAAANYTPLVEGPMPFQIGAPISLLAVVVIVVAVAVATFGVLALGLLSAAMDRRFAAQAEREASALRENERYLRDIVNSAHDAYVATDAAGTIIEWNAKAAHTFGWSREEVLGRPFATVIFTERDRPIFQGQIRSGHDFAAVTFDGRSELDAIRKDGKEITVEMTLAPVSFRDQVTYHAFLHDIGERKAVERELVAAKEMAESSDRAKSEFLAHMSHELRTPLNAIIGFSEIIRDQMMGAKPEAYKAYAADIHSSGQHLLEIINDILDLSKAEGGYLELRARAFDVPKMLNRCVDTVRELARKVDIEIAVIVGKNLPALYGEERRIRQIVLNLLSNAVKFTPAGGCIGVRTDLTASGDLQLIVEDSGIGMTKNQIEVALTPFRQVESHLSRRYEGAGLGLPLARRFAELHEGKLIIDSAPDAGTRISVTFPKDRLRPIPLRQVA